MVGKGHNYGECQKCGAFHTPTFVGKTHTEETKKKISSSKMGQTWSNERKEKHSQIFSGAGNPMYGKHHSVETKEKIGNKNKIACKGKIRTAEQKINYSSGAKKSWKKWREEGRVEEIMKKIHTPEAHKRVGDARRGKPSPLKGRSYLEIFGSVELAKARADITSKWMGDPKTNIANRPGAREKISKKKIEFYKKYPEKHANRIMAKGKKGTYGFPSKPQLKMFEQVKEEYLNEYVELEYPVKHSAGMFYLDVAIPTLMLGFEYDEPYWHNAEKDKKRDRILGKLGWSIVHCGGDDIFA